MPHQLERLLRDAGHHQGRVAALLLSPNCERYRIHLRGAHNDLFSRIAKQEGVAVAVASSSLRALDRQPGATKAAVLAALKDGSAMTAGEIAAATGLGRATTSTTLSKLAKSGEITKAARGYQIPHETDAPALESAGEAGTPTDQAVA
jgi:DNA-binding transcriptional ArsR family regulator